MMLFKRIVLNNFRQYYGEQKIDFACATDKNVTIINGVNGAGKTSLFSAINWCFYNEGVEEIGALVSKEEALKHELGEVIETSVKIWFTHLGTDYVAIRKAREKKLPRKDQKSNAEDVEESKYRNFILERLPPQNEDFKVFEDCEGGMISLPDPNLLIDSALPKNARQYFLFDGEKIEKLTKPDHDTEVRDAVRNILQLPSIENVKDHLSQVLKDITREARKHSTGDEEEILMAISEIEAAQEGIKDEIDRLNENLTATRKLREKIDADLKKLASIRHLIDRRQDLENQHLREKNNYSKYRQDIREQCSSAYIVVAQHAIDKGLQVLLEKKRQKLIPPPVQEEFIKSILDSYKCICGTDLKEGSSGRESVVAFVEKCAKFSRTSQELSDLLSDLQIIGNDASHVSRKILDTMKQIISCEETLESTARSIEDVHNQLEDQPEFEAAELEKERYRLDKGEQEIRTGIAEKQSLLKEANESIKRLEQELEKIAKTKKAAKRYLTFRQLSEKGLDVMSRVYEVFAGEKREEIEIKLKEIFESLIWKDSQFPSVGLTDEYKLEVYDLYGSPAREELSAGERQVLSLSFITAMALISGGKIPLVMDTPFGRLHSAHRENIVEQVPSLTNQWILMVQDQELTGEARKKLNHRVGVEYELNFEEGCTNIDIA
jgi:DNA sulfur modification protein DndD